MFSEALFAESLEELCRTGHHMAPLAESQWGRSGITWNNKMCQYVLMILGLDGPCLAGLGGLGAGA